MSEYIITGASGWLGRNFLSELIQESENPYSINLKENDTIKCLCLENEDLNQLAKISDRVEWIPGDLRSGRGLDKLFNSGEGAVLVHLAGLIHPAFLSSEFDQVNYLGSKKLINLAISANVSKMVIMSSNSPLGCNPSNDHLFTEESPYSPYLGYGKSKYKLELFLLNKIASNSAPPIVILRAPWFYGPYQPPRQKLFFEMVQKGKFPILGDGSQKRSMVYTGNLCQGLCLAIRKNAANNQIFWIADEEPYSINYIVQTIKNILSKDFGRSCSPKNLNLPSVIGDFAYLTDFALQSIGLYQQKIHVLSEMNKTIACSIEKSKNILGYAPQFSLAEGMALSIKELIKR